MKNYRETACRFGHSLLGFVTMSSLFILTLAFLVAIVWICITNPWFLILWAVTMWAWMIFLKSTDNE